MTESTEWTECVKRLEKEWHQEFLDYQKRWDRKIGSLCRQWNKGGRRLEKTGASK